ncbi:MAG TPA: CheR family methyltransferase [Vicinamibacterales bacterium]
MSGAASSAAARDADGIAPQAWCDLIVRRCGLAFRHIRMPEVIGIVHGQMRARGIAEADYYALLAAPGDAGGEWEALIERLTNHETSFFRHPPSFDTLRLHILPELRVTRPAGARLSLWSAGCSTGQEAYSLAMCAIADNPHGQFTVWGSDISPKAIKIARQAQFGRRAVATIPEHYRQRYLVPAGAGNEFTIVDDLRQRVRFMVTNLVEADGFRASHDVVFCHNVLIYFSPAAVTHAVNRLAASVGLGGYLLLGPGEAPHDRPPGLEPVMINGVRAFQRRTARPMESRP